MECSYVARSPSLVSRSGVYCSLCIVPLCGPLIPFHGRLSKLLILCSRQCFSSISQLDEFCALFYRWIAEWSVWSLFSMHLAIFIRKTWPPLKLLFSSWNYFFPDVVASVSALLVICFMAVWVRFMFFSFGYFFFPSVFSVLSLWAIFVEWVVWGILFVCVSSDGLHVVYLLASFLCFTCFHLTTCIFSSCSQYIGALSGGIPKFIRVAWGAFVPVGYTSPCPSFQPWENHTWWWSQFKEPPWCMYLRLASPARERQTSFYITLQ